MIAFVCLWLCIVVSTVASNEKRESVKTLPPTVAQTYGPAGTIMMWHDTNDDGNPDYRATYVFKSGRMHLINGSYPSDENFGYVKYVNPY